MRADVCASAEYGENSMDQAEKLRNVVRLKKQENKPNARVITITSGKGGVGKSNVAVNLAIQIQKLGKRVLIFDADFGLANVEVMFGEIPQYNLGDLIYHGRNIREIITEGPNGIGFISGGTGIDGLNNLAKEQVVYLVHALQELDQMADVIIVDTGAGISSHVLEFVMASPEVVLVTTPDPSSLTDSYSLMKALYKNAGFDPSMNRIYVLSNKVISEAEGTGVYEKLNSVVEQFLGGEIAYIGMIPQDRALEHSVRQQRPVSLMMPQAKSAKAFESVASRLIAPEKKVSTSEKGISRFFLNFLRQNF